jgi:hypothetical protein
MQLGTSPAHLAKLAERDAKRSMRFAGLDVRPLSVIRSH